MRLVHAAVLVLLSTGLAQAREDLPAVLPPGTAAADAAQVPANVVPAPAEAAQTPADGVPAPAEDAVAPTDIAPGIHPLPRPATAAVPDAPGPALHPKPRPVTVALPDAHDPRVHPKPRPATAAAPDVGSRPKPRPVTLAAPGAPGTQLAPAPQIAQTADALARIHPKRRPAFAVVQPAAKPAKPQPLVTAPDLQPVIAAPQPQISTQPKFKPGGKGGLCQVPGLRGRALPAIRSKNKGCNVPQPVLISEVAGVTLNPPATINCEEAAALSSWIIKGLQPAFKNSVTALNVADSYACRPRNNVRGAVTSVHGLGQAIDISGFVTRDGRTYTVAQNYNAQIRAAQKAGCGTFHTILGPGSDGYHENHIHFDVAHHRGNYCH